MQAIRNFVDAITYPFRMLARIPSSVISSPRRMLGLSLPARTALLLFFGLLVIVIIWSIVRVSGGGLEPGENFLWRELPAIIVLMFLTPFAVWYALKLWLEGEPSPFPEIDNIWASAQDALREQSIDPAETPIFLVLGLASEQSTRNFFAASNVQMPVAVPSGPAPMHVYGNQRGIYLVCTQTSCVGALLGSTGSAASPMTDPSKTMAPPTQTMQIGADAIGMQTAPAPGPGTAFAMNVPNVPQAPQAAAANLDDVRGTMMVGDPAAQLPGAPITPPPDSPVAPRLDPGQSGEATAKLRYVCRCLRKIRDPLCPINGVLVTTPFKLLADGTQDTVNQLQMALKSDLESVRSASRVRCSVTHVVHGMEEEPGFRELIRRVGADRVATQRFGKGFGLWNVPTKDQLDALVKHACGAFEDWSYLLFREEEGLSKRGNRHLYGLLCRIRTSFRDRLSHLVQSVYAADANAPSVAGREPLLFSGCYFVASGQTPDRHAFLSSVLQKTQNEEEELEWGSEAIGEENRLQTGVQLLLVLSGIFFAAIVAMLIHYYFRQ